MGKKEKLADFLDTFKVFDILGNFNKKSLSVINYHRLYSEKLLTQFDEGVFGCSVDEFEAHLRFIKNNFDILSEQDVIDIVIDGKIPKRCALITFDDGYIDNYNLGFPLLKSYNVPAIFFIPTEAVDNRIMGWWDIASYLIKKSTKKEIIINSNIAEIDTDEHKKSTIALVIDMFKNTPYSKTKNLLKTISENCEVEIPSRAEQSAQLMTWSQLKEMSQHNIAIGSHTHSHRVLSTLDENEQSHELKKSKEMLEAKLKVQVNSLSYPVGDQSHFSDITKEKADSLGYRLCFSFYSGINKRKFDPFDIKRLGLSADPGVMKGQLFLPSLFH